MSVGQMNASKRLITIVVPVYGDLDSLKVCIKSLIDCVDTKHHTVMFVNDCGPEVEEMEQYITSAINGVDNFDYYRNRENLGFVGTCNRAVNELDRTDNDILLLNSDTQVTKGFLGEMTSVLCVDNIAAVTPRSNNATLATIPVSSAPQKGIDADESYDMYQKMKDYFPQYYETPVAHGFCMLIRREVIKEHGLFDAEFGKGYGEEVDFCMRIREFGYRCALANRAYVFHLEARSFTPEAKAKLLKEHNQIIWKRYPEYRSLVGKYMQTAVVRETVVQHKAGITNSHNAIKNLIMRHELLYRATLKIRGWLKKQGR